MQDINVHLIAERLNVMDEDRATRLGRPTLRLSCIDCSRSGECG